MDNTSDLIRRLIESFIDHREALWVDAKALPGRIDWKVKVHADDSSKVIGLAGAHIKALQHIVAQLGAKQSDDYRLTMIEPDPAPRRPRSPERRAEAYDAEEAAALLRDLLAEVLDNPPRVLVASGTEGGVLLFKFQIIAETHGDYGALTIPFEDDASNLTLIAALGTLFRAYAKAAGVIFKLETNE